LKYEFFSERVELGPSELNSNLCNEDFSAKLEAEAIELLSDLR